MSNFIKFQYKPGNNNPLPMIMINNTSDINVYNEEYENEFGKWIVDGNHYFTIGSYIIEKNGEIISYKYNDFSHLVWLLRYMNKRTFIYVFKKEEALISAYYQNEFLK